MLHSICDKKGFSLVEVMIAIFLTAVGIMALLALQPTGWRTMAQSDYVGRASGILNETLENYETILLNPCNSMPANVTGTTVYPSGQSSAITGDVLYKVTATFTKLDTAGANVLITTQVTWPPINNIGIQENMTVRTQEAYRYPAGCANATR